MASSPSIIEFRLARHTKDLKRLAKFYQDYFGFAELGRFNNHDGYDGIMLGLPGANYHLEFTQSSSSAPESKPGKDDLLVFYFHDEKERDQVAERLSNNGYLPVEPANPYWKKNGVTFEDPDGWRVALAVK